jgi:hypothetical protein
LTPSSILSYLAELEKEFPVTKWKLFGFHIWPVIRVSLGLKLSQESFLKEKNQLTSSSFSLISDSLSTIYNSLYNSFSDSSNNQSLKSKYDIVFLNVSSTRYYKLGTKWFNPFSDSFINFLEKKSIKSLVLEYPDVKGKIPRYRASKFIGTLINLMNLNVLFQKKFEKAEHSKPPDFDDFLKKVNLPLDFFLKKILRVLNYSVLFEKILKKTKPSLVIVEGFYSYIAMGMVLAAKKNGIKCIDVQHGVQSENDFLYSNWENIPSQGYELLPDIFWCWSNVEKENIDKWTSKSDNLYFSFTGGNPVLELNGDDSAIKSFTENFFLQQTSDSKNILYTHQASFEISELLFIAIQNSPENWKWWIRFHPQYPEAQSKILTKLAKYNFKNVITEQVTEYPLPLLLKNMDLHVTEFSSAVLEAKMLGVPSILLSETGADLFKKEITSGIAKYSSNSENFFKNAEVLMYSKRENTTDENENNFKAGIKMIQKLVEKKAS